MMKTRSAVSSRLSALAPRMREVRGASTGFTLIELLIVIAIILLLSALTVTVIAIILLLSALTVTVIVGIQSRTEVRDTENTMRLLDQALVEWELAMGRQVAYGIADEPCEGARYELLQLAEAGTTWSDEDEMIAAAEALRTSDMLWSILRRSGPAADIIARVNHDFLVELDPAASGPPPTHFTVNNLTHLTTHMNGRISFRILDAWDNPIIAVMPGRAFAQRCVEPDGSINNNDPDNSYGDPDDDGTIRTPFENRFGVAVNRRIFFVSAGPSGRFGDLSATPGTPQYEDAMDNIYSYEVIRP